MTRVDSGRQAGAEITPSMIEAGAIALMDSDLDWDSYEEIARAVLLAAAQVGSRPAERAIRPT